MATYTITVNERTKEGKGQVNYLKTLGVIDVPNETTRKAIQEIREGKGTVCNTFEEDGKKAYVERLGCGCASVVVSGIGHARDSDIDISVCCT